MRRGKINHKGRARKFTSPEELEQERRAEQAKQWRSKNQQEEEEESSSEEESGSGSESGSESSSDDDKGKKVAAGASAINVENPNRVAQKTKKVTELDAVPEAKPQLSRREREELEKQRAREHYQKLHAAGKTEEARADLARLAIIKKQREEAAKKREEERLQKEAEKAAKSASISKALGKKS